MLDLESATLPKLFRQKYLKWGDKKVALRQKDYGLWNEITWKAYFERVKQFALGLKSLGFSRGEHVAIIGHNKPEWVIAQLAVQSIGGVVVGIYQDSTAPEVQYILEKSDAVYVVAQDQEQVDKLLEIRNEIRLVKKIIYWEPKGMRDYDDALLMRFQEISNSGRAHEERRKGLFNTEIDRGTPEELAVILTTSGTTSQPKLAMLSHINMLKMAENLLVKTDPMYATDEFISVLPLPWVGEQMISVSGAALLGFTVNFPEEPSTVQENIREIAPHVLFGPPRVWEGMLSSIQVRIEDATWLKKLIYRRILEVGYKIADLKFGRKKPNLLWRILHRLGYFMLFRAVRDRLGLSRIRNAYTGGAALGPDVFRFYHAIGVNLKQIYGQTEIAGVSVVHRDHDIRFDTVGKPIAETDVKISEDGEILSRSPSVFQGYYRDHEATDSTLKNGWLHSGDA